MKFMKVLYALRSLDWRESARESFPTWRHLFRWRSIREFLYRVLGQNIPPKRLALSFAVGIYCALLPVPGHTFIVTAIAVMFRLNLPAAIAGTWTNLPFLLPFTYGFSFLVGELLTGMPLFDVEWGRLLEDAGYWVTLLRASLWPMVVGTTVVGLVAAVASYFVVLRLARRLHAWGGARVLPVDGALGVPSVGEEAIEGDVSRKRAAS